MCYYYLILMILLSFESSWPDEYSAPYNFWNHQLWNKVTLSSANLNKLSVKVSESKRYLKPNYVTNKRFNVFEVIITGNNV